MEAVIGQTCGYTYSHWQPSSQYRRQENSFSISVPFSLIFGANIKAAMGINKRSKTKYASHSSARKRKSVSAVKKLTSIARNTTSQHIPPTGPVVSQGKLMKEWESMGAPDPSRWSKSRHDRRGSWPRFAFSQSLLSEMASPAQVSKPKLRFRTERCTRSPVLPVNRPGRKSGRTGRIKSS